MLTTQLPQSHTFWSEGILKRSTAPTNVANDTAAESPSKHSSSKAHWLKRWTTEASPSYPNMCYVRTWADVRLPVVARDGATLQQAAADGAPCRLSGVATTDEQTRHGVDQIPTNNSTQVSGNFTPNFDTNTAIVSAEHEQFSNSGNHGQTEVPASNNRNTASPGVTEGMVQIGGLCSSDSCKSNLDEFFRHCEIECVKETLADALSKIMEQGEFDHTWDLAKVNRKHRIPYNPLSLPPRKTIPASYSGQLKQAIYRLILRSLRDSAAVPPRWLSALANAFTEIVSEEAELDSLIISGRLHLRMNDEFATPDAEPRYCILCKTDIFNRCVVAGSANLCPACYVSNAASLTTAVHVDEFIPMASILTTRADICAASEQRHKEELTIQLLSNKCRRMPLKKRKLVDTASEPTSFDDHSVGLPAAKRPCRVAIESLLNTPSRDDASVASYESGDDRSPMSTPPRSPTFATAPSRNSADDGSDGDTGEDDEAVPPAALNALATAGVSPKNIIQLINNEQDRRELIRKTGFSNNYIMKLQRRALWSTAELQLPEPKVHRVPAAADPSLYVDIHVLFDRDSRPLLIKKELCAALGMKGTTFSYWKKKSGAAELDTSRDFRLMDRCRAIFGGRSTYTLYTATDALAIIDLMMSSRQRSAFANLADVRAVIAKYAAGETQHSAVQQECDPKVPVLIAMPASPVLR